MTIIIGGGTIAESIRQLRRSIIIKGKTFEEIAPELIKINKHTPISTIIVTSGYLEKERIGGYDGENINKTVSANFLIPILIANLSVRLFPEAKLVFFSSSVVFEAREGYGAYAASKTGLEIFLRTLKVENPNKIVKIIRNARTDTKLRWSNYPKNEQTMANLLSPDEVAKATLDFINKDGEVMEIFKRDGVLMKEIWDERG